MKNISRELPDAAFTAVEQDDEEDLTKTLTHPAEQALLSEIDRRRSVIDRAVEAGDGYRQAFAEASGFATAVDRFFTEVFVMVDDRSLREARLRLMKHLERLIGRLADISEIVREEESSS